MRCLVMNCLQCGSLISEGSAFCTNCGAKLGAQIQNDQFLIVTTSTIVGYKIKRVLGLVTGLTPRTRGILGQFVADWESMVGGEVTAFISEVEKIHWEAIGHAKARALALSANASLALNSRVNL